MFNVTIGEEGLTESFQVEFPKTTECVHCKKESRIGFVACEDHPKGDRKEIEFVCNLHQNDPNGEGYWLHDACAVAVYFCKGCLKTTALYNQG